MELLFEFLFQIVFEFVLQVAGELLVELGLRGLAEPFQAREARNPFLALIGYAFLGFVAGGISLIFFPHPFIRGSELHGISLLISPLLAGGAMSLVGMLRRRRGETALRLDSFGYGFIFAFAMALVRLMFTN
ncbi:MAG: hypothetical protein ACRD68_00315 [Pyrinomonadaceae bacterium]